MPPRLRPTTVAASASHLASTSAPSSVHLSIPSARSFSSTPQRNATRLRRRMWEWLNGPGKAFRQPLPGSTNYLGAYSPDGQLIRLTRERKERGEETEKPPGLEAEFSSSVRQESTNAVEGVDPEGPDGKAAKADKLPPEDFKDLRPFPRNGNFVSQRVLSEELQDLIYKRVVENGDSIVALSVEYQVSMERIAAVVRLKEVEKKWVEKGKELAIPYAKAVMQMLPTTPPPRKDRFGQVRPFAHESINDLPVHHATRTQLFHPVPESRHFTRADAAKAFHETLLPADHRIPHPELILLEKARLSGLPSKQISAVVSNFVAAEERKRKAIQARKEEAKKRHSYVVQGRRWDFVFEDCSVEDAGQDGRGRRGVGWRYGIPHQDRKRGQVKIPTSVDV